MCLVLKTLVIEVGVHIGAYPTELLRFLIPSLMYQLPTSSDWLMRSDAYARFFVVCCEVEAIGAVNKYEVIERQSKKWSIPLRIWPCSGWEKRGGEGHRLRYQS